MRVRLSSSGFTAIAGSPWLFSSVANAVPVP
jgi:hypothetical protein